MTHRPARNGRSGVQSAATLWPAIGRFVEWERGLGERAERRGVLSAGLYEFIRFGVKQAWACLFGALMLGLIIATRLWYPHDAPLARYNALVVGAIAIQAMMIGFKLETWDEVKVIFLFHLAGTAMELFKTAVGSWIYPEPSVLRIGGVPLYSGFMYASIGSYLARAWRLFEFRFTRHPPLWATGLLSLGIYVNFFAPLPARRPGGAHRRDRSAVRPNHNLLSRVASSAPHAAAARLHAGRALHLVRREYRDRHGGVDLPASGKAVEHGAVDQAGSLAAVDDRLLHADRTGEPTGNLHPDP